LTLDDKHRADPTCAFASNGTLYGADMTAYGRGLLFSGIALHRSVNLGQTWRTTMVAAEPAGKYNRPWFDREWLATDASGGTHRGSVYFNVIEYFEGVNAAGVEVKPGAAKVLLFHSWDRGANVRPSQARKAPGLGTHPGQTVVLSDGTIVHGFFAFDGKFYITTSSDGGLTISKFHEVGGGGKASLRGPRHDLSDLLHWIPMLAVDQSGGPYRDRVYMAWSDQSSGRAQIWLTYSVDRHAQSWTPARPIDDAQAFDPHKVWKGPNDSNPAIAVNNRGVVGLFWADRRDARNGGYWPRFMASFNGGETFTQSVRVGSALGHMVNLPRHFEAQDLSGLVPVKHRPLLVIFPASKAPPFAEPTDHWGLTADANNVFHPVWVDGKTGVNQIWTAQIAVAGNAYAISDVTDNIKITFGEHHWDAATRRVWVDASITNISDRTIRGPFVLKSIDPAEDPSFNTPPRETDMHALNADNGWPGPGAYWILRVGDKTQSLAPGSSTQVRRLEFLTLSADANETFGVRVFSAPDLQSTQY
jgi:hypothetical protein